MIEGWPRQVRMTMEAAQTVLQLGSARQYMQGIQCSNQLGILWHLFSRQLLVSGRVSL